MENTGRIQRGLLESARRILFGETSDASINDELRFIAEVDRAHLVMLVEAGLVSRESTCRLLRLIDELRRCDFAPLRGRPALRGVYLLYEEYLAQELGAETGGVLQTARSRNDLNSTVLRLRLREPLMRLLRESLRLQAVLLRRSRRHVGVVMPVYTHYQAAVPVTYGHYLSGVACALERDIEGLWAASSGLNYCPLGAGAVGGTTLPISAARTAGLLGFDQPVRHSIDAVASRDLILRLLGSAAIMGVTLSRLASDLLLWATAEFNFISLPDQLVGSSSMMPQKRNPFLLEHIQGRSAAPLGAFVNSATAMHSKPFTNTISVGTEAVKPMWDALKSLSEATLLARLVVAGAQPNQEAMLERAANGYTAATELANRLVVEGKMPFRKAHHTAGTIIREAIEQGGLTLEDAASRSQATQELKINLEDLNPSDIAQASIYGGGPGRESLDECLNSLRLSWASQMRRKYEQSQKWAAAEYALNAAMENLCAAAQ